MDAQYNLGTCYANGTGVVQDSGESARWYRLAADQGDATAQFNLGALYQNGTGVPQNSSEAARWFRLAADQGHAHALAAVAQLGL
jgi:TPR repeat protein